LREIFDLVSAQLRETFDLVSAQLRETFDLVSAQLRETFDLVASIGLHVRLDERRAPRGAADSLWVWAGKGVVTMDYRAVALKYQRQQRHIRQRKCG
jgi:hypothetical protein